MDWAERNVVVTGGSTGIGAATVRAFAARGARVVIVCRASLAAAQTLADRVVSDGGRPVVLQADVGDPDQAQSLVDRAWEACEGRVDAWANFAGVDILTGDGAHWPRLQQLQRLLDVDLRGAILCSWGASERMQSQAGGGAVINMSWDQALTGMAGPQAEMFSAVKGGVAGFTASLARSVAPAVRVNAVAPGWIQTAFADDAMPSDAYQAVVDATPMARFGRPEDVAEAAVWLADDASAFVTGQTVKVNGGLVA